MKRIERLPKGWIKDEKERPTIVLVYNTPQAPVIGFAARRGEAIQETITRAQKAYPNGRIVVAEK